MIFLGSGARRVSSAIGDTAEEVYAKAVDAAGEAAKNAKDLID
jgi:hypothetical protein